VRCDPIDSGCGEVYPGDLDVCPKCGASTSLIAIPEPIDSNIYIYDIETYPNIFTCCVTQPAINFKWIFEISDRRNDQEQLVKFLKSLQLSGGIMVGFNNVHFDYPIIHEIFNQGLAITVDAIYKKAMSIISGKPQQMIWDSERIVQQLDLFKINHFDNKAKSTSLKALEFYMRMDNIQDLPYPPGTILDDNQKDELIKYNWHDVLATTYFYVRCLGMIQFRKELSEKYNMNFSNMSDSKIGSEIFIDKLCDAGIATKDGDRQTIQSIRPKIDLKECIPDHISFEMSEFQAILTRFKSTTLTGDNVKALFKNFITDVNGLEYVFGAGGLHASLQGKFESDSEYCILDLDVEAYYPSLIVAGDLTESYYPEHLGKEFSPIFKSLITDRKIVGKKTLMGQAYKLISNSQYGNMGNKYSPMFDLKCLLSVTLTGQLSLVMLIEQLLKLNGLTVIQVNTDGFTIKVSRAYLDHIKNVVTWWEKLTHLKMEYAYYSRMWIADVNNYIGEFEK